ncbi:MAG: ATP-binding protein [Anaerolineae bacterium]|nr:ATP-binding protein [Anaerolineae bacterium]NUQ03547.1 ATP-binding protein [Anaerolineae bacterium]
MKPLRDLLPKQTSDSGRTFPTSSSSETGEDAVCSLCGSAPALCGGMGFVRLDVPVDHPQFGKPVRCPNYRPTDDYDRIERLRELSNLTTYKTLTFDTFQTALPGLTAAQNSSLDSAWNRAYNYAQDPQGWLLLVGGVGCGKTHLAAAIGHERVKHGDTVIFVTAPDLLDHLRSTYGPSSEVGYDELFERLRTAPLLVLDDLGAENPSPWAREKLYQLMNYRYSLALPTVITTNSGLDQMEPRLRSRMVDVSLVRQVNIAAQDYRNAQDSGRDPVSDLTIYASMRFDNFDTRTNATPDEQYSLNETLTAAREYAEQPKKWLVLVGGSASGKTHLAAAIGNAVKEKEGEVVFVTVPDLLDKLRQSFGSTGSNQYDTIFSAVRDTRLLVLDDLGTQNATPWAREKLFQLLNYRYVAARPTVITIHLHEWDQIDQRIATRIKDNQRCDIRSLRVRDYPSRRSNRKG